MGWFEACWNDDSWNKLCQQYLRNDVDTIYDCYDIRRFIKKVKFNPPATIVFWTDNTKTVVKCSGEDYDPEKGLAMCICKKVLGDKGNYYEVFKKWLQKEEETESDLPKIAFNELIGLLGEALDS